MYKLSKRCISGINLEQILEPLCDSDDLKPYCREYYFNFAPYWANDKAVQQALNIRQGTIGRWDMFNMTIHYWQGKNDTPYYSYDIFSSLYYHKKLVSKNCRSLIFSGDHDMTFPYVGIEQWIVGLNLGVKSRWEPFYVDTQVGGYETTYAQDDFSLTFATVKRDDRCWYVGFQLIILNDGSFSGRFVGFSDIGSVRRIGIPLGAGHSVPQYKPKEAMVLLEKWISAKTYSSSM
ncbi:serine carboxypeptidase-like protein 16 [Tanacetum coccineum]